MNQEDYIKSLENLLILMCKNYEDTQKVLLKLSKEEDNEAIFKVPMIKGTNNSIGITMISELYFENPKHDFIEIEKEIRKKKG